MRYLLIIAACLAGIDAVSVPMKAGPGSVKDFSFSKDGSFMAFQLPEKDPEWRKLVIMHVNNRSVLNDTLDNVQFSTISWKGNEGIYYSKYDVTGRDTGVINSITEAVRLYHKIGTEQSGDNITVNASAITGHNR